MRKKILPLFFIAFTFSLFAQNGAGKISETLQQQFALHQQADFVVIIKQQADLHILNFVHGKEVKAQQAFQLLQSTSEQSQNSIQSYLVSHQINFTSYWVVNSILIHGDEMLAQTLAARNDVARILNNASLSFAKPVEEELQTERDVILPWGVDTIHANLVWQLGYRGQGVVVGGQDTGYDWQHPAIQHQYRGWDGSTADHNYNWHDAIHQQDPHNTNPNPCGYNLTAPCDDYGHGTHTMGTMTGTALISGDTLEIGVAPLAKWIGVRNMEQGWGSLASYIESFQWFIAPTDLNNLNADPLKAPDVINNSWICTLDEGCDTSVFSTMETVVDNVKAAGIVVVASAGNDGPACSTVMAPSAVFASSFTVGAVDSTKTIADFSSRGNVTIDNSGIMKPNVSAPGVHVLSCLPGNNYASWSGTSMAGPHVVGAVALLISANPALKGEVDMIENILQQTAQHMTTAEGCNGDGVNDIPNNTYGWGVIDAYAAVQMALTITEADVISFNSGIKIFPNPAADFVQVNFMQHPEANAALMFFDLEGRELFQTSLAQLSNTISIQTLSAGTYIYRLKNGSEILNGKIIHF